MNTNRPIYRPRRRPAAAGLVALALAGLAGVAAARDNDFPTIDRVLYVEACMATHPGPRFEMLSKCTCALDSLAGEISFDDYSTMSTAFNASTIGGERGGTIRDSEPMQAQVKRWRDLQSKVQKGCFLGPETK